MDAALEAYNEVMRTLAGEYGVPLYDVAQFLPKSLEYFYDDCHFNINGAAAAGSGLANFLISDGVVPVRQSR